jgi:pimeloyl-ACP methyl ester carboxylesterase
VVAHSFGGSRALRVCADYPGRIEHAIIVDSYFRFADTDQSRPSRSVGFGKVFPDYQSLRQRYRLMPEQPVAFPEILNYLAYHSARQTPAGWRWKFDPTLPTTTHEIDSHDFLARTANRVDIVAGELSTVLSAERAQRVVTTLRHGHGPVIMPQAHHHIMLDQPLALIGVLRALLA